jgi:hypothetical protein
MNVYLYLFIALAYLIFFIRMRTQIRDATEPRPGRLYLITICAALTYDAFVIATGDWLGSGDLLKALSIPRYLFRAVFTPLLIMTVLDFGLEAGLAWSRFRAVRVVFWVLTLLSISYGLITNYFWAEFTPQLEAGVLKYILQEPSPDLPFIILTAAATVLGLALFLRIRWPWLLPAAALVLAGALGQIPGATDILLDGLMLLFIWALVATDRQSEASTFELSKEEITARFQSLR